MTSVTPVFASFSSPSDDAESEAGESVASDAATIVQEDDDTEGPADTSGGARQPVRAAPETIPPPSANDRKYRQKRTAEYILGKKGEADIPLILKYVHHERERRSLFQQIQQRGKVLLCALCPSLCSVLFVTVFLMYLALSRGSGLFLLFFFFLFFISILR